MASLEKRVQTLEATGATVAAPRLNIRFVSPVRGIVGARLQGGRTLLRHDDETEAQFLARVQKLEAPDADA